MLRAQGNNKYFSQGVSEPKMHTYNLTIGKPERDTSDKAGIGIALERSDATGMICVKRIAADGSAAADGRLRVGDVILSVDGVITHGIGKELTNLIIGPEGTFVELVVEHATGQQDAIHIRRGAPQRDSSGVPIRQPYKSYQEQPYYLSVSDKEEANAEVAAKVAEMKRRILAKPDVSSATLSSEWVDHSAQKPQKFGVAQRGH